MHILPPIVWIGLIDLSNSGGGRGFGPLGSLLVTPLAKRLTRKQQVYAYEATQSCAHLKILSFRRKENSMFSCFLSSMKVVCGSNDYWVKLSFTQEALIDAGSW